MGSYLILFWAIIVLSQAGNIIRFCEADALAVAFYRLALAFILILPFSVKQFRTVSWNRWLTMRIGFMGILFALHFISWIMAIQSTKVANAATCLSLTPIFVAIGAYFFLKESISKGPVWAIMMGVVGVFILGFDDFHLDPEYFGGDLLALASGLFLGGYMLLGKSLRKVIGNVVLMSAVYLVAASFTLIVAFFFGSKMGGFSRETQLGLFVLALFPTILGHASLIYVMKDFKSSFVAAVTLVEPILAGIGALYLFEEKITLPMGMGYTIIVAGLLVLIYSPREATKKVVS